MKDKEEKLLHSKTYEVHGTTKLALFDSGFRQTGTDLEFFGNISAAPLGLLEIQKIRTHYDEDGFGPIDIDEYRVNVYQGSTRQMLETYQKGKYFSSKLKKKYELNCETAGFDIITKFGCDRFYTGADGFYGCLYHYKQYCGMSLSLYFSTDLYTFEELENRFLKLFKPVSKRNVV